MYNQDEVVDLVSFGLTSLQSRVYLGLLELGTSEASRVSSAVGIVRPEGYRVLRELTGKGLVERHPSSPSRYTAIQPDRALSYLMNQHKERLALLERKYTELVKSLSKHPPKIEIAQAARFSLIMGAGNVISRVQQLISECKHDYDVILSKHGLKAIREDTANTIIAAKRRGVRVRIISEIEDSNVKNADYISRYANLRQSQDLMLYVDIYDKTQVVLGPPITDKEVSDHYREVDLWTDHPRFVLGMSALFEKLWEASPRYVPRFRGRL